MKYTDQELIDELRRVSEEYCGGETPTQKDMNKYGKYSAATYERRFESWNDVLEVVGLKVNVYKDYTDEDLKEILIDFSEKYCNGEAPTREFFNKKADIHYSTIENRFGTWNKALKICGKSVNERHKISKEKLRYELFKVKDVVGGTPTIGEMCEYGNLSHGPYVTEFGSWNKALEYHGMEYNHKNNLSKEYIKNEIKKVSENHCGGKAPKREDMREYSEICQMTATNKFGSWDEALEQCGIESLKATDYLPSGKEHFNWCGGISINYGPSWNRQRNKAMKRDGHCCRLCERPVQETLIDVHHITPVRFWRVEQEHEKMNQLNNLISLCRSCHRKYEGQLKGRGHDEFEYVIDSEAIEL
jgi:5-methylcytosine-specific restriction endonuclease McrA